MDSPFEWLLRAAILAPSGDNTQPWRFAVDGESGRISFYVDEARDPSPMNIGQCMARIAVGAALENVLRTAALNGWPTQSEEPQSPALAVVYVAPRSGEAFQVEPAIAARVSNRKLYDGRPIADDVLARLKEATPPLEGVATHWITDDSRLPALAEVMGRADALMFGDPAMRAAFLKNVRFDRPPVEAVEEGLSLASLELSKADQFALSLVRWVPNWLFHLTGGTKKMHTNARKLVESAAGLCAVTAAARTAAADLTIGQAMQRAWLALTKEGLATQPMMSVPVLDNALENGTPEQRASLGIDRVRSLLMEAHGQIPEAGSNRLAYVLRFGTAAPPTGRTGRLPLRR